MSNRVQALKDQYLRQVTSGYEREMTITKLADKTGVSQPTISRWLRDEGYLRRRRGKFPRAMKYRAKDLSQRGFNEGAISTILKVPQGRVIEWLKLVKNPSVLSGEKDPLKIRGSKTSRKRRRPRPTKKRKALVSSWRKQVPQAHQCRHKWTEPEIDYVYTLIKAKKSIKKIYEHTRASAKRQRIIWKQKGHKGRPPNFPPRKPPRDGPPRPPPAAIPPAELERYREDKKRLTVFREAQAKLKQKLDTAQLALETQATRLAEIEEVRRQRSKQLQAAEGRARSLKAWTEKTRPKKLPAGKARVLPGSYEVEVMGLKPGTVIKETPEIKKRRKKMRELAEWADNGQYYVVSNDWSVLDDATQDDLAFYAHYLTRSGFPTKAEASGGEPKADKQNLWPKKVERMWDKANDEAYDQLTQYRRTRDKLKAKNWYSKTIAQFMANAYDAYRNKDLSRERKQIAAKRMREAWTKAGLFERDVMVFVMGVADVTGRPTAKGATNGLHAKRLLVKDAEKASKRLTAKRKKQAEQQDVADILAEGRQKLELPEGEE